MRTVLLMALMTAILSAIGDYFGGLQGFTTMMIISVITNFVVYWNCDRMVLSQYKAIEVDEDTGPGLYGTVKKLANRAGLPMPKVYVIPTDVPNAFATGRNPEHAVVAVNRGLVDMLSQQELEGVLAHELTHVKNHDILVSTVAATMASMISVIARFGAFFGGGRDENNSNSRSPIASILVMIVAPIAAALIQMAVSRSREYKADEGGGQICGNPDALADALLKIENYAQHKVMPGATKTSAHMFIINPFSGADLKSMFSTHPSTDERVTLLRKQGERMRESKK